MSKRSSTRNVVVSKAMKLVDEDTRREFRDRRIQTLEADNYIENESYRNDVDDAYQESDDEEGTSKRKKAKTSKTKNVKSKWTNKPVKSLERILMDNGISSGDQSGEVNYYSVAAKPSIYPPRQQFCQVCGYIGNYTCTRCGSRFCSIKCNINHKETRCFKFSM